MATFSIDGFEFGVDPDASQWVISTESVDITFVGRKDVLETLWDDDDHPWSWLTYPPKLYLLGLPVVWDNTGFERQITEHDLDEYDIAIYAMQHFDILPCRVTLRGGLLSVAGSVQGITNNALAFCAEIEMPRG